MKRFIRNTLLFGLLIVVSLAAVEAVVRSFVPSPYMAKNRYLESNAGDVEVLVLGNSHPFYGFRADLWPRHAFNLSNVSQTLDYDLRLLELWLPQMPNLRTVILELGVCSLTEVPLENGPEGYRAANYQIYMNLDAHPFDPRYNLEMAHMGILGRKIDNFLGLGKPALMCDSLGNGLGYEAERRWRSVDSSGPVNASVHNGGSVAEITRNLSVAEKIVELCRRRGVEIVIYTQPSWHTYKEALNPGMAEAVIDSLGSFTRLENLMWVNMFDDADFVEADFFDSDHLTHSAGAVKLTRKLVSALHGDKESQR